MKKLTQRQMARMFRKAVHVLKTRGWCKGTLVNDEGQYCAIGALARAIEPKSSKRRLGIYGYFIAERESKLAKEFLGKDWSLSRFNDTQSSPEPVINLFNRIADKLEGKL